MTVLATAPSGADAPDFDEVTVELDTFPSTENFTLHQFDSEGGTLVLDEVTITATVDANVDGTLKNLSQSVDKTLTASVDASIELNGTGVSGLSAGASDAETFNLAPQEEVGFVLTDTGEAVATITDPGQLEAFVGPGVLPYSVAGLVETTVSGPAPYISTGGANGSATVRIDYGFIDTSAPAIQVLKTNDADGDGTFNDVETAPEEGADVPFHIEITNIGNETLELTELVDEFGGVTVDLFDAAEPDVIATTCVDLFEDILDSGDSVTCEFTLANYAPPPGELESLDNLVTVTGEDLQDNPVSDDDPSTVNVAAEPGIEVVKTNDADNDGTFGDIETAPNEGADVDFQVDITNTGNVPLTLTSLEDAFAGQTVDLFTQPNCDQLNGDVLAPSETVSCTFTLAGYAPAPGDSPLVNTVTVTGQPPEGDPVTADDPSTVIVEEPPPPLVPDIDLVKTNDADGDGVFTDVETAPAEGADVPFEVVITNTGETDLTITELKDVFGLMTVNLRAPGLCDQLDGVTLPVGGSETCTFTLQDYAPAPGSLDNTVTVTGQPPDGDPVTDNDPSTVIVEEPPPPAPDCIAVPGEHNGSIQGLNVDLGPGGGTFNLKDGGTITITITAFKDGNEGIELHWTSTVGIAWFSIKAGNADHVTTEYDPPAFEDTLSAPINPDNGQPIGFSHFDVCAFPPAP